MLDKVSLLPCANDRKLTASLSVASVLLLSLICLGHASVVLDFQAEDTAGYDPANLRWRSNAAKVRSVLLQTDGDYLRFPICLPADGLVSVEEVRYSTDGWSKIGAVLVDGQEIETFETVDNSNFGNSWNFFHSFGPLSSRHLSKGKHTFDIKLKMSMTSDPWGMEIDEIKIGFDTDITRQDVICVDQEDSSSGTTDVEPVTTFAPSSNGSTPSSSDGTPNSSYSTPSSSDATTSSINYTPSSSDATTSSINYTPSSSDATTSSINYTPSSSDATTSSINYTPSSSDATTSSINYTPSSSDGRSLSTDTSFISTARSNEESSVGTSSTRTTTTTIISTSNTTNAGSSSPLTTSSPSTSSDCPQTEQVALGTANPTGKLTLQKNGYYACHEGEYRLDLFPQGQVVGLALNISRAGQDEEGCTPTAAPSRKARSENPRKAIFSVGRNSGDTSCRRATELAELTSESFSSIERLNAALPARVDPARLTSFSLRFSLPQLAGVESFRFSMSASCPSGGRKQLVLNFTLLDMQSGSVIVQGRRIMEFEDSASPAKIFLAIPASIRQAQLSLQFADAQQTTFVLHTLVVDYLPVEGNPANSKVATNDQWFAGQKRQVLFAANSIRLEVVSMPGAKPMKIKMTSSQNGNGKELSGSRILLYTTQDDSSQLRMIFDQTSRCYFFPERDSSRQVAFSFGQRDPEVDSPDSDLEEVEVNSQGNRRLSLTLTRARYLPRRIDVTPSDLLTELYITDVRNTDVQPFVTPQTPLSAVMLPCTDNRLTADARIQADDTDGVGINDPWRTVTGKVIRMTRRS